jgi:hypothetical protein
MDRGDDAGWSVNPALAGILDAGYLMLDEEN